MTTQEKNLLQIIITALEVIELYPVGALEAAELPAILATARAAAAELAELARAGAVAGGQL